LARPPVVTGNLRGGGGGDIMSCRWEAISVHKLQRARLEACHCSARGSRRRGRWWGRSPTTAGAGCGSSSTGGDGGSEFGVGAPARSCAGATSR
jgi:hypothetical protein